VDALPLVVAGATTPDQGCDAPGEREHDDAADDAGETAGEPIVRYACGAVVGERAVLRGVLALGTGEAVVLGHPVEPVRAGGGVVAHHAGEEQCDEDADDDERPGGHLPHAADAFG
jgi:hypothetical protein